MPDMSDRMGGPKRQDPEAEVALDAKGLRALAHPVRVQLVELLRTYGPSTATRLAARLGITSGNASYHLRQLGAAGLVKEDTERGNARERWWSSAHKLTSFDDAELPAQEPEATMVYLRSVAAGYTLRTQRALDEFPAMPPEWRDALHLGNSLLRLTPEEAKALQEELNSLIARYRQDDPADTVELPEGTGRVLLISQILPEPEAR